MRTARSDVFLRPAISSRYGGGGRSPRRGSRLDVRLSLVDHRCACRVVQIVKIQTASLILTE